MTTKNEAQGPWICTGGGVLPRGSDAVADHDRLRTWVAGRGLRPFYV